MKLTLLVGIALDHLEELLVHDDQLPVLVLLAELQLHRLVDEPLSIMWPLGSIDCPEEVSWRDI